MSENKTSYSGGIGTTGLLGVVFVTLKLCGVINWSWLWVLAPFWLPLAILLGFLGVVAVGIGIAWLALWIASLRVK